MNGDAGAGEYVYLYRDAFRRPMYVGRGGRTSRAMSHTASHNAELAEWLATGPTYTIEVSGPYRTGVADVESALITAMEPVFNRVPGDGRPMLPLGVPHELADRFPMAALNESEIGVAARGALIVYIKDGEVFGRASVDPAHPDIEAIAERAAFRWRLGDRLDAWSADASTTPQVLVAVFGPRVDHRFVLAAFPIDVARLTSRPTDLVEDGRWWEVPLLPSDGDAAQLRGRRVTGIRFGQGQQQHYHWVDAAGAVRWGPTEA